MSNSTQKSIRFRFSPAKAKEAIAWMLDYAGRPLDLHTILKACYFADKAHLNAHNRPVFGAIYRAMKFGPVPLEIYEMLKCEPMWLAELQVSEFPWRITGHVVVPNNAHRTNLSLLSESDISCLEAGLKKSLSLDFNARTAATHGRDWQKANLGYIDYADMIEDSDDKVQRVEVLRQTAPLLRL